MGSSVVKNNLSIDFRILRKNSASTLPFPGLRHRVPKGEMHKISNKLIIYMRPVQDDSEISTIAINIYHIDHMRLLSSFRTLEVFVSSCHYNPFDKTIIACTLGQTLDIYSLKGKGAISNSIPLPRQTFFANPKVACINKSYAAILFPFERVTETPGFYIVNLEEKIFEQIIYPIKPKCLLSIDATNNSAIIVQGIKKGGDGFISLYSFATKTWLQEFRCSPWASIKRIFPSNTSNQIVVLKETIISSFLLGYQVNENGTIMKLFEIEIHDFSSINTIEHVTENLLIARCTRDDMEPASSQKVILINTKLEKYYLTNFHNGVSCSINKNLLCNLERNQITVAKIPLGVHILDKMLEHLNSLAMDYKKSQGITTSLLCSTIEA